MTQKLQYFLMFVAMLFIQGARSTDHYGYGDR